MILIQFNIYCIKYRRFTKNTNTTIISLVLNTQLLVLLAKNINFNMFCTILFDLDDWSFVSLCKEGHAFLGNSILDISTNNGILFLGHS